MKQVKTSEWALRFLAVLLALSCVWSVWSQAPSTSTTNTLGASTNSPIVTLPGTDFIKRNTSALSLGLDRVTFLQPDLLGRPRWQYVSTLLYIVLAFVVSKRVDRFINNRLKVWASRTSTRWDDVVVGLADGPVKVVTFVVLMDIGLHLFEWPQWVEGMLSTLAIILAGAAVGYVALKGVDAVVGVWRSRLSSDGDRAFNEQFLILIGKLFKAGVCIVVVLTILPKLGVDTTALLGSVSVLGLALGLAAQDTVANLFGAVAVFVDKPFRIGDRIQVDGIDGTVEGMGLRATTVRSLDGFLITIPNKTVGNNKVVNISRRPTIKSELNFGITYDTPTAKVERATQLLEEIFKNHPETFDVIVTFNKFLDSSLNLQVVHWWKGDNPRTQLSGLQQMNLAVKSRFEAEGIEFAFPTQTVYNKFTGDVGEVARPTMR